MAPRMRSRTRPVRRIALALLMGLVTVSSVAGPADASLVKNGSGYSLHVWFDCGVACGNYFNLDPNESASRPGKAGDLQVGLKYKGVWVCSYDNPVHVPAHGEAVGQIFSVDVSDGNADLPGETLYDSQGQWVIYDSHDNRSVEETDLQGENSVPCFWGTP